jgi:hypothetical protein
VTVYCVITALKELGNQKNGFNFDASTVYMHDQYHGADERNFAITGNYSFGFDSERKLWGHSIDPRGFDLADYNRTRIALVRRDAPAI